MQFMTAEATLIPKKSASCVLFVGSVLPAGCALNQCIALVAKAKVKHVDLCGTALTAGTHFQSS